MHSLLHTDYAAALAADRLASVRVERLRPVARTPSLGARLRSAAQAARAAFAATELSPAAAAES